MIKPAWKHHLQITIVERTGVKILKKVHAKNVNPKKQL